MFHEDLRLNGLTDWEGSREKFGERSVHKGMRILLNQEGGLSGGTMSFRTIIVAPVRLSTSTSIPSWPLSLRAKQRSS